MSGKLVRLDAAAATTQAASRCSVWMQNELAAVMTEMGEPGVAKDASLQAIYRQRVADIDQITTLATPLRTQLDSTGWAVSRPGIAQVFPIRGWNRTLPGGDSQATFARDGGDRLDARGGRRKSGDGRGRSERGLRKVRCCGEKQGNYLRFPAR